MCGYKLLKSQWQCADRKKSVKIENSFTICFWGGVKFIYHWMIPYIFEMSTIYDFHSIPSTNICWIYNFPPFFSNSVYTQWTVVLFLELLNSCPERLCYGIGQTQRKDDSFVSTLTIYNELFVYEDNTVHSTWLQRRKNSNQPSPPTIFSFLK